MNNLADSKLKEFRDLSEQVDQGVKTGRIPFYEVMWFFTRLQMDYPVMEVKKVVKKLLKFVDTVVVPAMKKFIAKKFFVVGKNDIKWIGDNFEKWFLNIVEEPVEETEFRQSYLLERSVDNPIIKELGGRKKAQIFLGQIANLMDNVLKRDGTVYVFYAETTVFEENEEHLAYENKLGKKVVLRTVLVYWHDDGWGVGAYTVEGPDWWIVGYQIFSRNSC